MRHRADPSEAEPGARRRLRLGVGAAIVLVLGAFVVAILTSAFAQRGSEVAVPPPSGAPPSGSAAVVGGGGPGDDATAGPGEVFVHVSGAVVEPGLVTLGLGARVVDAIAAAGGLTPEADPAGVNLARLLSDGEQLVVPKQGEAPVPAAGAGGGGGTAAARGAVNLNTAGLAELETLPRIGPALAQRILDWREANGRFTAASDLMKVTGIGDKVFDGLKDQVTV
ncbi:helix-hairpin-helix domain-containing protein [Leifsonia sp. NPDC058194]|uniref:helix-hairpin-helix domain-containing protein n=1 Tax=Leifsonia sp. NPDC058194 TaxID=3346374 RepID=UPI0036DA4A0A